MAGQVLGAMYGVRAIPIMQGASLEEDDSLQDRWAALLVNAANASYPGEVRRSYATILEQLTPLDAKILDVLYSVPFNESLHRGLMTVDLPKSTRLALKKKELVIERFYPMNLLQKLSMQKESASDWRELVESVMIDWNYDGAVLQPAVVDIPDKNALVSGTYSVPADAGTIMVKITDLLSESLEVELHHG